MCKLTRTHAWDLLHLLLLSVNETEVMIPQGKRARSVGIDGKWGRGGEMSEAWISKTKEKRALAINITGCQGEEHM